MGKYESIARALDLSRPDVIGAIAELCRMADREIEAAKAGTMSDSVFDALNKGIKDQGLPAFSGWLTADGRSIKGGDSVYRIVDGKLQRLVVPGKCDCGRIESGRCHDSCPSKLKMPDGVRVGDCYSTEGAARAAEVAAYGS